MTEIPGFRARTTAKGYRIVELDARADPARGDEWHAEAKRSASTNADFQREVMRNWNITSGASVFPEFSTIGREHYLYEPSILLALPIICGFDFGHRAPGMICFQYAPKSDRVYVLREWMPNAIGTHHFRDVCMHLRGQLAFHELDEVGQEWVRTLRSLPGSPPIPWFPLGVQFVNLSGPEITAVQANAAKDPADATARLIFSARGVEFDVQTGRVKGRISVLRRLLAIRADGHPGILISPHCGEVLAMLDGGLTFKRATPLNPKPEEPKKDGRHDNTFDALTYGLVGSVPADGQPGVTPGMPEVTGEEDLGWTV